jgi:membrane fusion protein, heavy metal efflux system
MTPEQVDAVLQTGRLLGSVPVSIRPEELPAPAGEGPRLLQVQELPIAHGQHITAGDTLAVLANYAQLLVEGEAFERDSEAIMRAMANKWPLRIASEKTTAGSPAESGTTLEVLYVADTIDPTSRTFHFYASLANEVVHDRVADSGERYIQWRYRPGERLRLIVPIDRIDDQLVVPLTALAEEGVETYVFQLTEGHFVRTAVEVLDRDDRAAVIATPKLEGKIIAMTAAQQLQFALAAQSSEGGGGHHGHAH